MIAVAIFQSDFLTPISLVIELFSRRVRWSTEKLFYKVLLQQQLKMLDVNHREP